MNQVATENSRLQPPVLRNIFDRGFYLGIVVVMTVIVLLGFRPFYTGLFDSSRSSHWLINLHAALFSGWMVLLAVQVALVFRRRVAVHQQVGRFGIAYGIVVLTLGLAVTFVAPILHVLDGKWTLDEAAGFLILPIGDMLMFAGFFSAGIFYRRKRDLHKRLMLLATIALLFAPAARLGGDSLITGLTIWMAPLALAIAYDVVTRRRVEPVLIVGTVVLLVGFARIGLMDSENWLVIGRSLLTAMMRLAGVA